jgi:hypothetical protein
VATKLATKPAAKTTSKAPAKQATMQIYRAIDGKLEDEDPDGANILPMSQECIDGFARLVDAGMMDGSVVKTLIDIPGFALTYCWFKPHFPLPRHSHKQDCLYYIVKGDIKLGTERLGAGDGFFLPDGTPYTYDIGEDGVELLEFRTSSDSNFRAFNHTPKWWDKAEKAIKDNREAWKKAKPPRAALTA